MAIHNIKGMRVPSVYRNIGILPIHHPDKYHQNLRRVTSQTADRDDMKKKNLIGDSDTIYISLATRRGETVKS